MRKMNLFLVLILILGSTIAISSQASTYTIEPGDTLDTIGKALDVSVVSLQLANEIEPGQHIFPGDVLTIPADATPYGQFPAVDVGLMEGGGIGGGAAGDTYVVQPQDTLDVIGQERDVSVVSLIMINDIDNPRAIMPGMTLLIPDDAPAYGQFPATDATEAGGGVAGGNTYIIQLRDTIDQIAANNNVATACIVEVNEITQVRNIQPGQTIVIPNDCPPYVGFAIPSTIQPTGGSATTDEPADTSPDPSEDTTNTEDTSPSGASETGEDDSQG